MLEFQPLKIEDCRIDGASAMLLEFHVPEHLQEVYRYKAGQHLTLRAQIDGRDIRRSYSIYQPTTAQRLAVGVRKVNGGIFSNWIFEHARTGRILDVLPPMGNFSTAQGGEHHWFFAAGCGITPILSLLADTLEKDDVQVSLFYLNKTLRETMLFEELQELKNTYPGRLELYFFFTQEVPEIDWLHGRLTTERLSRLRDRNILRPGGDDQIYLCGPDGFIETIRGFLLRHGCASTHIHFESFGVNKAPLEKGTVSKIKGSKVSIKHQGKTTHLIYDEQLSLLEIGLKHGLSLPFACQAGVCGTCRCRLLSGEVSMMSKHALEEHDIQAGTILSCQSYPANEEDLIIDYDI